MRCSLSLTLVSYSPCRWLSLTLPQVLLVLPALSGTSCEGRSTPHNL